MQFLSKGNSTIKFIFLPSIPPLVADQIAEFCRNCGMPNTDKNKFCRECGTSLIKNTGTAQQPPAPSIPPKMDSVEKLIQLTSLRERIVKNQKKIDNLNKFKVAAILAVIAGILSMF